MAISLSGKGDGLCASSLGDSTSGGGGGKKKEDGILHGKLQPSGLFCLLLEGGGGGDKLGIKTEVGILHSKLLPKWSLLVLGTLSSPSQLQPVQ